MINKLRRYADRIRGIRRIQVLNRGAVRLKSHFFDDFWGNILWPHRPKEIGIHGGLGDVILLLPFIKRYRETYPRRKIRVIYTDIRTDQVDIKNFGLGQTRLEKAADGKRENPIADFLENISFIDEKIGGDPTKAKDYWFPDKRFRKRWGGYPTPSVYSKTFFPEIFSPRDRTDAEEFWKDQRLKGKFAVAFHFRRGSDKIVQLYKIIQSDPRMKGSVQCICLGSSLNQTLPLIGSDHHIDLTDNYTKGIPLRTLYQIVMKCQLFVGGRGSFEHFFWIARVPSINFMDDHGLVQDQNTFGTWIPEFWSENKFKDIIRYENADPKDIYNRLINPYFTEWKEGIT